MVLRAGLPLQDMEFVQFHPTGIYGAGCLITEGVRGEGGILRNSARRALHGALCAEREGPGFARRRQSRDDDRDSRRPRRRPAQGSHPPAPRASGRGQSSTSGCPASPRRRKIFAGVDVTKQPIPVLPTVHYNMGGIPANYHGEVVTLKDGKPDSVVPGLMAVGEAACVSVHGANRLGSNSLLDLVVFGREAARHCAASVKPGTQASPAREGCRRTRGQPHRSIAQRQRLAADGRDPPRHAAGDAEACRGVPHRRVAAKG